MLNEYLWKGHEVVCLPQAPSCFYPSLPERQHSKATASAGCVEEAVSAQRLVETGGENADVTRAEQASSEWRGGGRVGPAKMRLADFLCAISMPRMHLSVM